MPGWKERLLVFYTEHRWTIWLVALGLLIGILILTINFWRTLLLMIVVGLCFVVGSLMDKGGWEMVKTFLDRILPRR